MSTPIFTRRHYVVVADLIREAGYLEPEARGELVADLCESFGADNERFDPNRFRAAACNGSSSAGLSERDRLEARGYRDGYAAATWFTPADETTAGWILDGLEAGDPEVLDYLPASRLGGEWAGEPTWSDVLEDEGCEPSDDGRPELLGAYEWAYACAVLMPRKVAVISRTAPRRVSTLVRT